ncbi:helix-turn-helix domain-containing protein [Permianibacter aggregans]|uniref:Xre family transcriptional regulator n=1 Tax=Permianibacter aggregans TaxID=1510150 RepID=A0A4V3D7V5_9GAMM|nr:helix-turn-helix domain-containing protein [Permianibacter aggregans]QGX40491.1 transcriptional regulator [Permianibacter aggregans]TDQ49367.1 Xre family transcriptional regulator [Permianibacter aggregans]
MSETPGLMTALKQQLKAAGISYKQVAEALALSEASIKRLMNSGELSLNRLNHITALCGLELSELVQLAERQRLQLSSLSREQEQELVADEKRLLVTYLLLNDWQPALIQQDYQFDWPELIRHLAALDRMQLIDLLPGNRVRLRAARDFAWLPDGPIQQYFDQHVREPFFAGDFQPEGFLRFMPAMVSKSSAEKVRERLAKTAREIAELVRADAAQPTAQREGCSVLLAFRGWAFPAFDRYRR